MTLWDKHVEKDEDNKMDIVAQNVSLNEAQRLCNETIMTNINAYINSIPNELKNRY